MGPLDKLLSILLAFVLIASACGSDGGSDEASEPDVATTPEAMEDDEPDEDEEPETEVTTTVEAMEDDEPEPEQSEGAEASGDPVLVGYVGTSVLAGQEAFDAMVNGLQAAEAKINGEGGIDGRPIEVLVCDDQGDPNLAVDCAQQHIDAGAVTFVGNFTPFGDAVNPVIGEAGYSVIGGGLYTPGDFGVEFLYSTNGGAFTAGAGGPVACIIAGATQLGYIYNDSPAGAQVPPLVEGLVTGPRDGVDLVITEPVGLAEVDFAPAAAKVLAENPDCVTAAVNLPQVPPLIQALRDQGYDGKVQIAGDFNTSAGVIDALGDAANGVVLGDIYDQTSAGYEEYVAAIAEFTGSDAEPLPIGVMGWLGLHVAADVIGETGDDPAAITAGISGAVVGYDTGGLTAKPLDWSVPGENPLGITNLRDTDVTAREIVDGEVVFVGEWSPVFVL